MSTELELPIAYLEGVIETPGEEAACSLVFVVKTTEGKQYSLNYGLLMQTLHFAEHEGIIPPLSPHWWARIGSIDGCTLQKEWRC